MLRSRGYDRFQMDPTSGRCTEQSAVQIQVPPAPLWTRTMFRSKGEGVYTELNEHLCLSSAPTNCGP
jgi:hypothetical protein